MPASRTLRFKIGAAAVVLVAALGALEALARVVAPIIPAYTPARAGEERVLLNGHATRLWYTAPGVKQSAGFTATINALGLRGELPADPKPADVPRILVLGDSSLFGHGVADDETLPVQLEQTLRARGQRVEVINGGTPGYSTEQTLVFLDEVGWDLKPDLLVVGNLWSDNNYDWFQDADLLHTQDLFSGPLSHSALFRLAASWGDRLKGGKGARVVSWTEGSQAPTEVGRRVPLPRYGRNLATIADEARAHGAGVVFLALTNLERLAGDDANASWVPYFAAQREVARWYGVPVVDAHLAFMSAGVPVSTLFVDKMHPSAAGFRLIAKATSTWLAAGGWPEKTRFLPKAEPFPGVTVTDDQERSAPAPLSPQEALFRTPASATAAPAPTNGPPTPSASGSSR